MFLYFYSSSHFFIFTALGGDFLLFCVCCTQSLSHVQLCVTPWTVAHQAPLSLGVSRQEYRSGLPCPPPGDLPHPGIKSIAPALQADSLPLSQWESPPFLLLSFFFFFNKHILSFECFFFITSRSFFIDVVSSPFLLRILNIDFFFYYILLPVLSLYSLSSYCFLFCSCQPITIVTCLSYLMPFDHLLWITRSEENLLGSSEHMMSFIDSELHCGIGWMVPLG